MILFFQQWRGELLKLFARRRTYIGFGAFVLLELLILWLSVLCKLTNDPDSCVSMHGYLYAHLDNLLREYYYNEPVFDKLFVRPPHPEPDDQHPHRKPHQLA